MSSGVAVQDVQVAPGSLTAQSEIWTYDEDAGLKTCGIRKTKFCPRRGFLAVQGTRSSGF